jgi:hypothetical protein
MVDGLHGLDGREGQATRAVVLTLMRWCVAVLVVGVLSAAAGMALGGCGKNGGSAVSWEGGIVCKDGVCTPTLTLVPAAPAPAARAQLEK